LKNRILITGASGQLGEFFVKSLIKDNNYVLATDIRENKSLDCDFEFFDIFDFEMGDQLIKKYKINQVYNFAAILSAKGEKDPLLTWEINNAGFINIARLCLKNDIKKIFWPSSIAVFGHNSNLDFVKNDEAMLPETMYGVSKLACEKVMFYFNSKNLIDIRSIRFPGIVSNSEPGGGTTDYIIDMLYHAKKEKNYTCFLKENAFLPMMHIDDAIDASIKLMKIDKSSLSKRSPYNISSFETSPSKWLDLIKSIGYDLKMNYKVDYRQKIADSWPKKVDDTALRKDIKWSPKYNDLETAKHIINLIQL
tara:strand:- start:1049 stop:1972 length:924 start_codon:yes stop_codon:yes gene_type:complete